jgi:GST-like protein
MIDFYIWYTSNARKVAIMLEETGLEYQSHVIDIGRGDQFTPEFLTISPNNKIPAILDPDGPDGGPIAVFESGAILVYLAEKTGSFLPAKGAARYHVMQWLMFQMASVGPMFGQYNHFHNYAREDGSYAKERYAKECNRLYRVMEKALVGQDYIAGDYSIADMALWPWAHNFAGRGQDTEEVPHVVAWAQRVGARDAVKRAMEAIGASPRTGPIDNEHWENMYGATQYEQR